MFLSHIIICVDVPVLPASVDVAKFNGEVIFVVLSVLILTSIVVFVGSSVVALISNKIIISL